MSVSYHAGFIRSAWRVSQTGAAALGLTVAIGCGPPREPNPPPEEPPAPVEPSVPQTERLEDKSAALPILRRSVETSEHFGEALQGDLRLREELWAAYQAGEELPEGAQIAFDLRTEGGAPRAVLWMEKRAALWTFAVEHLDQGAQRGVSASEACQRCHAEAPRDSLFRIGSSTGND